jgi:hypothetical protein
MSAYRVFRATTCFFLALTGLPAVAQSQPQAPDADQRAKIPQSVGFSINYPIDVPGAVLQPGTYVLRIKSAPQAQNANENLNVLEVLDGSVNFDEKLNHVVARIYAKQVYDSSHADGAMLTYYESTSGRRALKAWSHFPTNYIEQVVYSLEQAGEISKTTKETVLAMSSVAAPVKSQVAGETADRTLAPVPASNEPVAAVTETAQPPAAAPPARSDPGGPAGGDKARDLLALQAKTNPARPASEPKQAVAEEFPKTAGDLPMVVWLGVTTLVAFLLFKLYRRDPAEMHNARNNALARRVAAMSYRNYKIARGSAAGKQQ